MKRSLCCLLLCVVVSSARGIEFGDGERVALLGTTVVERDQRYGYIESMISPALAPKRITFRNLGWSGDTVFGDARSYFGPPREGLDRLRTHLALVKPTVVFACYGAELAFENAPPLPDFIAGYRAWLDLVRDAAENPRVVIIAPPALESLPGRPSQDAANQRLASVRDALRALAEERGLFFIDTFAPESENTATAPRTTDGIHFSPEGQHLWAQRITRGLGLVPPAASDEQLRSLIVRKDELFFHRHRPANETYLFLFRKHEQGRNAAEIPQFDPLIAELDQQIHAFLSRP